MPGWIETNLGPLAKKKRGWFGFFSDVGCNQSIGNDRMFEVISRIN